PTSMPLEEVPCSSPRPNSQRAHNTVCSLENYVSDVDRFLGRISPVCGAGSQRRTFSEGRRRSGQPVECHKPRQPPAPGFGEKYWSLSGSPSLSLASWTRSLKSRTTAATTGSIERDPTVRSTACSTLTVFDDPKLRIGARKWLISKLMPKRYKTARRRD